MSGGRTVAIVVGRALAVAWLVYLACLGIGAALSLLGVTPVQSAESPPAACITLDDFVDRLAAEPTIHTASPATTISVESVSAPS